MGYQGELYEFEKRYPEALELTDRAPQAGQAASSPYRVDRWEWQIGRILTKQGKAEPATEAYRRTVTVLHPIPNDIAKPRIG